jgi:nucleoside phosphorylase
MVPVRRFAIAAFAAVVLGALPVASHAGGVDCTGRLLVLTAFPGEMDGLISQAHVDHVERADGHEFFFGSLRGDDVIMSMTGIGMLNAERVTKTAFDTFRCGEQSDIDGVVFSGVSGGRTFIGDVTVPARWSPDQGATWLPVNADMLGVARAVASGAAPHLARDVPAGDPACAGADPNLVGTVHMDHAPDVIVGGDGRSSDPFGGRQLPCFPGGGDVFGCRPCRAPGTSVPDAQRFANAAVPFLDPNFFFDYFQQQPATSGADADDMETAAAARVAAQHDTPFIAFRALSDGQGDPLMLPGFPFQFFFYRQLAANNAATVALAFLEAWGARA